MEAKKNIFKIIESVTEQIEEMFSGKSDCKSQHQKCNTFKCFCERSCKKMHITIDIDYYCDHIFIAQNPNKGSLEKELIRQVVKNKLAEIK